MRRLVTRKKMMVPMIAVKTKTLLETIKTTIKDKVGEVQNRSREKRQGTICKCLSSPLVS